MWVTISEINNFEVVMEVDSMETPKVVVDELTSVGVKVSGHRHVDIPNFWAVMEVLLFTINSPKYAYYEAQLTWKQACRKPHCRLIKGEWVKQ